MACTLSLILLRCYRAISDLSNSWSRISLVRQGDLLVYKQSSQRHPLLQPGVASVYCTIVQQTERGVEFYLKEFPELVGMTFQEARRAFDDAVLCGYMRNGGGGQPDLYVNCKDLDVIEEGDRVIALSETGKLATNSQTKEPAISSLKLP